MGSQFEVECCSPFLPLELRVERCSRDRTLGSFDTFIHEGMKTEYLSSRCFHVFHVRAVFLSLFFFFKWNCYMRFWENWDGFIGAWLEKVWKDGWKFVLGRLGDEDMRRCIYNRLGIWRGWFCILKIWKIQFFDVFKFC